MSGQLSRGSAGKYQADDQAGVALLRWRVSGKPPEAFGERSGDWSPGHAGDEGPHLSMTGESRGCSRAAAL